MHGVVPEHLRGDVYQLFGCERCQTACPLNSQEASAPYEFSVKELLSGGGKEKLRELAGGNMARERRIISQSALYAANARMFELADDLMRLSETAEEPVKTHALWAYKQLTGEDDDNA
jgi:epoxyqueuosine reductase QueG